MSPPLDNASRRDYELLDFGEGRKLERIGAVKLDRPSPAAANRRAREAKLWASADLRFEKGRGETGAWKASRSGVPKSWQATLSGIAFRIRPNASGNVGLFPEAALVWDRIASRIERLRTKSGSSPPRLLNLFAYTGGASLVAAAAGAAVVHVDSSSTSVAIARENATLSGLSEAPIRWIVEDARKFVVREVRRGNAYDLVLLDPPSWGHGPKGEAWRFEEDLENLLRDVAALLRPNGGTVMLTGHSPGWDADRASDFLAAVCGAAHADGENLTLKTRDGRTLDAGWLATGTLSGDDS